jgi:hypothetical protein
MHRRTILAVAAALMMLAGAPGGANAVTPASNAMSADAVLAAEAGKAAADDRKLLLLFDASWCVYCRLTDMMLERPEAAKVIGAHYRVLHMRAQERTPEMKAKQLAGADELYDRLAPDGVGMPLTLIIGADGEVIASSVMKSGENYGFPVTRDELDGFEAMMKAGAPSMTKAELKTLRTAAVATYKAKPGQ